MSLAVTVLVILLATVAIQGIPVLPQASDELMELSMNSHENSKRSVEIMEERSKRAPPKGYVYTRKLIIPSMSYDVYR
ncbi:hypothetical protein V3C99_016681 [Haemonchus contortus]